MLVDFVSDDSVPYATRLYRGLRKWQSWLHTKFVILHQRINFSFDESNRDNNHSLFGTFAKFAWRHYPYIILGYDKIGAIHFWHISSLTCREETSRNVFEMTDFNSERLHHPSVSRSLDCANR